MTSLGRFANLFCKSALLKLPGARLDAVPLVSLFVVYCLALFDGNVGRGVSRANVVCTWTDEAVVVVLLDDVGSPTGDAAYGKDGGEEVDVDAEHGVSAGGVEVYVGVELLFGLDVLLDLAGHTEPLASGGLRELFA